MMRGVRFALRHSYEGLKAPSLHAMNPTTKRRITFADQLTLPQERPNMVYCRFPGQDTSTSKRINGRRLHDCISFRGPKSCCNKWVGCPHLLRRNLGCPSLAQLSSGAPPSWTHTSRLPRLGVTFGPQGTRICSICSPKCRTLEETPTMYPARFSVDHPEQNNTDISKFSRGTLRRGPQRGRSPTVRRHVSITTHAWSRSQRVLVRLRGRGRRGALRWRDSRVSWGRSRVCFSPDVRNSL